MARLLLILLFLLSSVAAAWPALPLEPVEIEVPPSFYAGNKTVAYIEDLESGLVYAVSGAERDIRHPPFSSFKIPNLLIALETGAAKGLDDPIPYDPHRRPAREFWPADWARDQTLQSAFKRSAAWAFQDLALEIGETTYQGYLEHFAYGNEQVAGDAFWLDGTLEISPKEQVDFLRKLLTDQFEVAPLNLEKLRQAALARSKDGFSLYGKTGSGPADPSAPGFQGEFQGWYVGWLERPGSKPVVFALWTRGPSYQSIKDYRQPAVLGLLEQAGYLPLAW